MDETDDSFLVIIENKSEDDVSTPLTEMAKEVEIEGDGTAVEDIIKTAEKHGEFIDIKVEQDFIKCEDLDDMVELVEELEELEEECLDSEVSDFETLGIEKQFNSKKENRIVRKLKPELRKSFVNDLKEQYPELKENEMLLVNTLAEIMNNVKPPPPPDGYFEQEDTDYICTICGAVTVSEPAAGRHYQEYHGPRYLVCYACGVDFRSKTNLYKHEKTCSAPCAKIVLKARVISIGSKARSRPYLHLRKSAPLRIPREYNKKPKTVQSTLECSMCSKTFNTKLALISHEHMHRGERPYRCHVCPAAYTSKPALWRHAKKHSDSLYICDYCGRQFKFRGALIAHIGTHLPRPKYVCEVCSRHYTKKHGLKIHIDRVHKKLPPPCACQICPKRYPDMSQLKIHMKKVHGLIIMTPKMFMQKLPMMTESELRQSTRIVFKEKDDLIENVKREPEENSCDNSDVYSEYCENEEFEIIVPDEMPSQGFLAYIRNKNMQGGESSVCYKNGEIAVESS